ncbi:CKLF-like MARVEL transmembrane domain-containing protein 6 isoform X2 [Antennarius striatus]|uniref:CKLF-like MARVEL transmembrane domain-containing protein 6 isoform X2 n=1 Tax=Antennarius striatus TaxID=241820 RepID=UPI0035B47504
MALNEVYSQTTAPNPESSWFTVPSHTLDSLRFAVKVCEVLLSLDVCLLVVIGNCYICMGTVFLYLLISTFAFLASLVLLIFLSTKLHTQADAVFCSYLDLCHTTSMALLFLIASTVFFIDYHEEMIGIGVAVCGLLTTVVFCVDIGLFLKFNDLPLKTDRTPELGHGDSVEWDGPPGQETLTMPLLE